MTHCWQGAPCLAWHPKGVDEYGFTLAPHSKDSTPEAPLEELRLRLDFKPEPRRLLLKSRRLRLDRVRPNRVRPNRVGGR